MDHVMFTQLCNIKRPLSNAQCIMQTTSAWPAPIKFRMFLALGCGPRTNKCTASCHYSLLIVYCLFCGQCWRVLIFVFARIFALSRGFLWIVQRKYSWKLYLVLEILYIVPGILYIVPDYFIYSSGDFIYSSGLIYVFVFFAGAGKFYIYSSRGCAAVAPRLRRGVSGGAAVVPRSRCSHIFGVGRVSYGQPDRPVIAWLGHCAFYILLPSAQVVTPNQGHEQTLCAATHQEPMLQHFIIDHSIF